MRFYEFNAQTRSTKAREAVCNEAVLVVFPDEFTVVEAFIREHDELEITDRVQPGINEGVLYYIRCEDEWVAQGLERSWTYFHVFLRTLKAQHR